MRLKTRQSITVIKPGFQSSIQELPGRTGHWSVGVPPSGPMDSRSFRYVNRLVGNHEESPALEITLSGPTLRFSGPTRFALCGAEMSAALNNKSIDFNTPHLAHDGDVLSVGSLTGYGQRAYFAVTGAFDVDEILGSCATFVAGNIGHILSAGYELRVQQSQMSRPQLQPERIYITSHWTLEVIIGPHTSPQYLSECSLQSLLDSVWKVDCKRDRAGIRLNGPKPEWLRNDGGSAGLHPSNVPDTPYSIGAVHFMGDNAVIVGPDGPSLGGFCAPFCVMKKDLWKLGQLAPGDTIRFKPVELDSISWANTDLFDFRHSSDNEILVEYKPYEDPIRSCVHIHCLMSELLNAKEARIVEMTPGVCGLLIQYSCSTQQLDSLINLIRECIRNIDVEDVRIPSRKILLPLCWSHSALDHAVELYAGSIRDDAPWSTDNRPFIAKLNGFESCEQIEQVIHNSRYLVLGLGDVYLGSPLMTAIDPRDRLVSTKYNPARTWTPEGAVGLGGEFMCIYGMESPGGYQLVGKTIPCWNSAYISQPHLFNWFDQISYYPVTENELDQLSDAFKAGEYLPEIVESVFDYQQYLKFLDDNASSIKSVVAARWHSFDKIRSTIIL